MRACDCVGVSECACVCVGVGMCVGVGVAGSVRGCWGRGCGEYGVEIGRGTVRERG